MQDASLEHRLKIQMNMKSRGLMSCGIKDVLCAVTLFFIMRRVGGANVSVFDTGCGNNVLPPRGP